MPFLFLSPSTQDYNPYVTTGNEEYWMNRLADEMEPYLEASGINVKRNDPSGTVGTSIRLSNQGNYDFHLALHSNASPESSAGSQRGIDVYYFPGSTNGLRMANIIVDNLREVYPNPEKVRTISSPSLVELRRTNAPAVLVEMGYHDNYDDARWIENNLRSIAMAMALSVTEYFGLPDLSPGQVRRAVIHTNGSSLNLRNAPSSGAPVLTTMPNGADVHVLNEYNGWYVVRYNGTLGYASGAYLSFL